MKLHVKTFGCQMNEYDSARMSETMRLAGWELTEDPGQADLVLFNSCSIRALAEEKLFSALGETQHLKARRPEVLVGVTGCTAQLAGDRLLARAPGVDLLVGPDRYGDLPALVEQARKGRVRAVDRADPDAYSFVPALPESGTVGPSAFVTIMKGCDNHCAYCVVPAARGPEVSRPAADVVAEAARFVAAGAREVFLIGQNVNSYQGLPGGFPALLRALGDVPGLARIRFTTSHPKDFGPDLVAAMAEVPSVCEWLHLPVQAGATRTLRAMRRRYTREAYLEKIDLVRARLPHVAITTDVIVGFPGETEADFEETLSLLALVRYDALYSFRFSPRPGTLAASLPDDVPLAEKQRRLAAVQALQAGITRAKLSAMVGRTHEVLVEGGSRRGGGQVSGRTRSMVMINFVAPLDAPGPGALVPVEVTAAGTHTLEGRLAGAPKTERLA